MTYHTNTHGTMSGGIAGYESIMYIGIATVPLYLYSPHTDRDCYDVYILPIHLDQFLLSILSYSDFSPHVGTSQNTNCG